MLDSLSSLPASPSPIPSAGTPGAPGFVLDPVRLFHIWPSKTYAQDDMRVDWWPAPQTAEGIALWWRPDHEDDCGKVKMEQLVYADHRAFWVRNAPSYRLLRRHELLMIREQINGELP